MTSIQEFSIPPISTTIPQKRVCPPPPRSQHSPIFTWSPALYSTNNESSLTWTDVVHPINPCNIQPALLSSQQADDIIHPDIKHLLIRQRGSYWWENSQALLEHQFSNGTRQPEIGGFYVFLEEEQANDIIVRYGNILMGTYWVMQTVAFPKGHPDADVPPYQMIDARQ
jgi:hypothetical protein